MSKNCCVAPSIYKVIADEPWRDSTLFGTVLVFTNISSKMLNFDVRLERALFGVRSFIPFHPIICMEKYSPYLVRHA